jgi:hypothetical protein
VGNCLLVPNNLFLVSVLDRYLFLFLSFSLSILLFSLWFEFKMAKDIKVCLIGLALGW